MAARARKFFACIDGKPGDDASRITGAHRFFASKLAKEDPMGTMLGMMGSGPEIDVAGGRDG